MTRSKPRARESRFGIANAINSGFLLARGRYVTVLQVPPPVLTMLPPRSTTSNYSEC